MAGFTLEGSAISLPHVSSLSESVAASKALQAVSGQAQGFTINSSHHDPALLRAYDPAGGLSFSSTTPDNAWVFWMTAPAQNGWRTISALVIIDAGRGDVIGYQVDRSR